MAFGSCNKYARKLPLVLAGGFTVLCCSSLAARVLLGAVCGFVAVCESLSTADKHRNHLGCIMHDDVNADDFDLETCFEHHLYCNVAVVDQIPYFKYIAAYKSSVSQI